MVSLCLVAALNLGQIPTEGHDRLNYGQMTREQLVRERQRVADERPGSGAIAFAWIATFIGSPVAAIFAGFAGYGFSEGNTMNADAPSARRLAPGFLVTALVGAAIGALGITVIVVRGTKRTELGHELDVIDDVLDHPQARLDPEPPMPVAPQNTEPKVPPPPPIPPPEP